MSHNEAPRTENAAPPGLTHDEATLLQNLHEAGEADARGLSRRVGLRASAVTPGLERLRQLEYVSATRRKGTTLYRAKISKPFV